MNEILFFICIASCLSSVLLMGRFFGKEGLFVYSVFATLLGNIAVTKSIDIFGLAATGGNILYASVFLATDILSEMYGKKDAKNCVKYSFVIMLMWLVGTQLILLFAPNSSDLVNDSLKVLFGLTPRITAASLIGYLISQNLDVFLYHHIWKKTGGGRRALWLRNNAATLISQAVDTLVFTFIAFYGVYDRNIFISIVLTTYFFKAIVALLDTPFLYLARKTGSV